MRHYGKAIAMLLLFASSASGQWSAMPISTNEYVSSNAVYEVMMAIKERWEAVKTDPFVVTNVLNVQTGLVSTVVTNTIDGESVVGTNYTPGLETTIYTNTVPPYPTRGWLNQLANKIPILSGDEPYGWADLGGADTNDSFAQFFADGNLTVPKAGAAWKFLDNIDGIWDDYGTNYVIHIPDRGMDSTLYQGASAGTNWTVFDAGALYPASQTRALQPTNTYPRMYYKLGAGGTNGLSNITVSITGRYVNATGTMAYSGGYLETNQSVALSAANTNVQLSHRFVDITGSSVTGTGANTGDTWYVKWSDDLALVDPLKSKSLLVPEYTYRESLNLLYEVLNEMRVTWSYAFLVSGDLTADFDVATETQPATNVTCSGYDGLYSEIAGSVASRFSAFNSQYNNATNWTTNTTIYADVPQAKYVPAHRYSYGVESDCNGGLITNYVETWSYEGRRAEDIYPVIVENAASNLVANIANMEVFVLSNEFDFVGNYTEYTDDFGHPAILPTPEVEVTNYVEFVALGAGSAAYRIDNGTTSIVVNTAFDLFDNTPWPLGVYDTVAYSNNNPTLREYWGVQYEPGGGDFLYDGGVIPNPGPGTSFTDELKFWTLTHWNFDYLD